MTRKQMTEKVDEILAQNKESCLVWYNCSEREHILSSLAFLFEKVYESGFKEGYKRDEYIDGE